MKFDKKIKNLNRREISIGLLLSLVIILLFLVLYFVYQPKAGSIWPALIVTQVGIAILWLVSRLGGFSMESRGFRRLGNSLRDRKINKLGSYSSTTRKKSAKPIWELEQDKKNKSKQGIYTMLILALIEFSLTAWTYL